MRPLLTFASALSLLLCMGTAALWVRSYWKADTLSADQLICANKERWEDRKFEPWSSDGVAALTLSRLVITDPWYVHAVLALGDKARPHRGHTASYPYRPLWRELPQSAANRMGFYFGRSNAPMPPFSVQEEVTVACPLWFIVALALLLPVSWVIRARGRLIRRAGFCRRCGYDLRATTNRCPECGSVVSTSI